MEVCWARIISFRQEPPYGPVGARCYERMCKTTISPKARRALILLHSDADDSDRRIDREIAKACRCRIVTVENMRCRCVLEGFDLTFAGKQRTARSVPKLLDGEQEAKVTALRLEKPPAGYANWSLLLLAWRAFELGIVDSISHTTVAHTLEKTATPTGRSRRT